MTTLQIEPMATIDRVADSHGGLAAVRRFNRFELKYLADRHQVEGFRSGLPVRLGRDPNGIDGFYPIWSTYYDTRDLRFYWEKIDGQRFRRKLRIRHYGTPDELTDGTAVWVEIKQRINRVTQKRRVRLPYGDALRLCAGIAPPACEPEETAVVEEILVMVAQLHLQPVSTVGYVREAFIGRDEESGLRLTIDSRLRGRDRDLDLRCASENRFIVVPHLSVVELKVNERVPYWLTEHIARYNLRLSRLSKYCQSVEVYGAAPRSLFHVPDDAQRGMGSRVPRRPGLTARARRDSLSEAKGREIVASERLLRSARAVSPGRQGTRPGLMAGATGDTARADGRGDRGHGRG